jgi:hypothetical protein
MIFNVNIRLEIPDLYIYVVKFKINCFSISNNYINSYNLLNSNKLLNITNNAKELINTLKGVNTILLNFLLNRDIYIYLNSSLHYSNIINKFINKFISINKNINLMFYHETLFYVNSNIVINNFVDNYYSTYCCDFDIKYNLLLDNIYDLKKNFYYDKLKNNLSIVGLTTIKSLQNCQNLVLNLNGFCFKIQPIYSVKN